MVTLMALVVSGSMLWRFLLDREDRILIMFNFKKIIGKVIPLGGSVKVSSSSEIVN